jgi:putative transcriptional regulator
MTKKYRSPVMASIHETAEGLRAAGVMDKQTMREFDDACLTPVRALTPDESAACGNAKAQARRFSPATGTSPL